MVVTEKRQERYVGVANGVTAEKWLESDATSNQTHRNARGSDLRVERTDIRFEDLDGDRVRIRVRVRNEGAERSLPTVMRLESAPLGVFAAWWPLDNLVVPPLEPGETRELSTEVPRPRPAPLGSFDRVPPKRLLTALSAPDQPSRRSPVGSGMFAAINRILNKGERGAPGRVPTGKASLAPDAWDLLGRSQPHWAGNINVFVGRSPVERHMAMALRVYPGRTNLATFIVGEPGKEDAYAFALAGSAQGWDAELYDATDSGTLLVDASSLLIEETKWVEPDGGVMMVMLGMNPPADCEAGKLEVHVTRRSSGKTAVVEFDLDPAAKGPGCYTLG